MSAKKNHEKGKGHEKYRHVAYLLHEMTCDDRDLCTYSEEYTTEPQPPPEERYHCEYAVLAENLAAELVKL